MNTPKTSKSDYLVMWYLIPEEENPQLNHGTNFKMHCVVMYYVSILLLLQVLHYIFYNSSLFQTATHWMWKQKSSDSRTLSLDGSYIFALRSM